MHVSHLTQLRAILFCFFRYSTCATCMCTCISGTLETDLFTIQKNSHLRDRNSLNIIYSYYKSTKTSILSRESFFRNISKKNNLAKIETELNVQTPMISEFVLVLTTHLSMSVSCGRTVRELTSIFWNLIKSKEKTVNTAIGKQIYFRRLEMFSDKHLPNTPILPERTNTVNAADSDLQFEIDHSRHVRVNQSLQPIPRVVPNKHTHIYMYTYSKHY